MKIAIVGTGISSMTCAHLLHPDHDITVFEADDRIGGHTNTVEFTLDDRAYAVDTGFIVYNERNYPNFVKLLARLGVMTQPSDMSFSVADERSGLEWRSTRLDGIFAQRRNVANPTFLRMLRDIVRFNKAAKALLEEADSLRQDPQLTLRDVVDGGGYSDAFAEQFLVPFGAAIWSADPATFLDFPALTYARFMANHGLLDVSGQPQWRTVRGGSNRYMDKLTRPFLDRIRLNSPVLKVRRTGDPTMAGEGGGAVELVTPAGPETFDRVILGCHSDQALKMLADPSEAEREVLGAIRYQPNVATLHTDEGMLPRTRRAWASWNYHQGVGDGRLPTMTYWMNLLQDIDGPHQFLVTLNRADEIDRGKVIAEFGYSHPVYDLGAIEAQRRRDEIQGVEGTFFAGAYWGYGFHEDGVRSALDVCRHFGVGL